MALVSLEESAAVLFKSETDYALYLGTKRQLSEVGCFLFELQTYTELLQ